MRPASTILATIVVVAVLVESVPAVPPSPETVDLWRAEGRLEQLAAIQEQARQRGVNSVPDLLKGRAGREVLGERQAIVLLVDFDDNPADPVNYPPSHFEEMLFSLGTYPTGSMRDFYQENSYGQLDLTGTVAGWYRMPEDYSYYTDGQYGFGNYPRNAQRLTEDAVIAADPYVDFSQFDNDGPDGAPDSGDDDGYVDALFVVHAGPEGAGGNGWAIWSHAWETSYEMPVDGVYVSRYSQEPEEGSMGVYCHELGHVFGLPDLYDYDYDSAGVGYWSVMSFGVHANGGRTPVHFDAWCKIQLGWIAPIVLEYDQPGVTIPPVETDAVVYRLWTGGSTGDQYFLAEHRERQLFDSFIPAEGLVVWHIDVSMGSNDDQCCEYCGTDPHCRVAVEQADGFCNLENYDNYGDTGDAFPGSTDKHTFDASSFPSSRDYSGDDTQVALLNITRNPGSVTLDIEVGREATAIGDGGTMDLYGEPVLDLCNPFEPGAAIRFYIAHPEGRSGALPVRVEIFDVRGRRVRTLADGLRSPGFSEVVWDGLDESSTAVASGVYFVAYQHEENRRVTKLLLAR